MTTYIAGIGIVYLLAIIVRGSLFLSGPCFQFRAKTFDRISVEKSILKTQHVGLHQGFLGLNSGFLKAQLGGFGSFQLLE